MKAEKEEVATDRRGFLKFAGISTIASGAALVATNAAEATEIATPELGVGYRETDHVLAYYASARF